MTIAARDLTCVRRFYCRDRFSIRQAPCNTAHVANKIVRPSTFADIAWNLGYDHPGRLAALLDAWQAIIREVDAEVIVCDFGLTASLAAKAVGLPRIAIGTGFTCPPATTPLTPLAPTTAEPAVAEQSDTTEQRVLDRMNSALRDCRLPLIETFADALCGPPETLLGTVPELDPYPRTTAPPEYLGIWDHGEAASPVWRNSGGPKAVAYLKPFKNFQAFHRALASFGVDVALCSDGIPASLLAGSDSGAMTVQAGLVDLKQAAPECQFGITNGNHGTTLRMLSLGLPVLACPLFIEQRCSARRLAQMGLGIAVDPARAEGFLPAVNAILSRSSFRDAAVSFAAKYAQQYPASEEHAYQRLKATLLHF